MQLAERLLTVAAHICRGAINPTRAKNCPTSTRNWRRIWHTALSSCAPSKQAAVVLRCTISEADLPIPGLGERALSLVRNHNRRADAHALEQVHDVLVVHA